MEKIIRITYKVPGGKEFESKEKAEEYLVNKMGEYFDEVVKKNNVDIRYKELYKFYIYIK